MLPTDPRAPVQQNLHRRQPAECQKVHVKWRSRSSDPDACQTATMAEGRRTSSSPSVVGRRAVPAVLTALQDWRLAGMSWRQRDQVPLSCLTTCVIDASLNRLGKRLVTSERLNSWVTNGVIKSMICFSTNVGKGWATELLSGGWRTPVMMSSSESVENSRSDGPGGAWVYVGGGALSVDAHTLATLSAKNLLTVSTVDRLCPKDPALQFWYRRRR